MSRRATAPISLSPGQARYVLERLVRDRVVSPNEVSRYVSEMQSEIDGLEARLYRLCQAMGDGAPRVASPVRPRRVVQGRSRASCARRHRGEATRWALRRTHTTAAGRGTRSISRDQSEAGSQGADRRPPKVAWLLVLVRRGDRRLKRPRRIVRGNVRANVLEHGRRRFSIFDSPPEIVEGVHARERHPGCGEERHEVARDHFRLYPFLPPQQFLGGVELHEPCFARHPEPFVDGCDFIEPIERVSIRFASREVGARLRTSVA